MIISLSIDLLVSSFSAAVMLIENSLWHIIDLIKISHF